MIESLYDFERSIEYKMSILDKAGKTVRIGDCLTFDDNGEPKKDQKPFLCKYTVHEMMVRLPSFFRDELVFIYQHSSEPLSHDFNEKWVEWLNEETEAEMAIYDPNLLLSILNDCKLLNDRRLINIVDCMLNSYRYDRTEMSIITIDRAIKTRNVFKRTKDFGFLLKAARGRFLKVYKYYLAITPKKKEIKGLPEEKRLIIETRLNSCLFYMCLTRSWKNAKILIKKYGATISANYYDDFANKDYMRDFAKDSNYRVVLKHLQEAKEKKDEELKVNLKDVAVRQPSQEELYGRQVSKDLD